MDGAIKPSPTHWFLRRLSDRGILRRVYTQNIDMLEDAVGLPSNKVIQVHGTLATARCITERCPPVDVGAFWDAIRSEAVPRCEHCGATARPNVVFFGEGVAPGFLDNHEDDMKACDLLIVMV